jgi:hypothetical protein
VTSKSYGGASILHYYSWATSNPRVWCPSYYFNYLTFFTDRQEKVAKEAKEESSVQENPQRKLQQADQPRLVFK